MWLPFWGYNVLPVFLQRETDDDEELQEEEEAVAEVDPEALEDGAKTIIGVSRLRPPRQAAF